MGLSDCDPCGESRALCAPTVARRLYCCAIGQEQQLVRELEHVLPASEHCVRAPGWVESAIHGREKTSASALAYAAQVFPRPVDIEADTISKWAEAVTPRIVEALGKGPAPFRLHVFCVEAPGSEVRGRRCELVEAKIVEALGRRRLALARGRIASTSARFGPDEWLVQVALESPARGLLSIASPQDRHDLRRIISRFPHGRMEIEERKDPPSRAYLKLLEAEQHAGRLIEAGERCVDLGASPGGWSFVALQRGAFVTAVDRSPLRDDLMANERLRFVRGDAFTWEPAEPPVDWLLCDVIAYPSRTAKLIRAWVTGRLCRRLCVTIKFKGEPDLAALDGVKHVLESAGVEHFVRHLAHNRNEVTVYAEL